MADKRTNKQWLEFNTYVDKRSQKRVLNKTGRVDLAHDAGLDFVDSTVLEYPTAENGMTAVVRTTVRIETGQFTAIGFANAANCGQGKDRKDSLPMAEARALNRALDLALNYGRTANPEESEIVAVDEDDAYSEEEPEEQAKQTPTSVPLSKETEEMIEKIMAKQGCDRAVVESKLRPALKVPEGTDLTTLDMRHRKALNELLRNWLKRMEQAA